MRESLVPREYNLAVTAVHNPRDPHSELEAQLQATLNLIPTHAWYEAPGSALRFLNERAADYGGAAQRSSLPLRNPARATRGIFTSRSCIRTTTMRRDESGLIVCERAGLRHRVSKFESAGNDCRSAVGRERRSPRKDPVFVCHFLSAVLSAGRPSLICFP